MNYERIYKEFIADRRSKEAGLTGYTEKHHILPRSLKGSDEPENLIRLTAGDHYFAHLLLAKIHGGNQWAALWSVAGMHKERRNIVGLFSKRHMVDIARRKKSEAMSKNNPSHLPHVKEMRRQQMLTNNPIHNIDRNGENNPMYGVRLTGAANGHSRPVSNLDTGEVFETAVAAKDKYGVDRSSISRVCKGTAKTAGGYRWAYV